MPLIGANGGLIGAARTSRRGAAVGLWTPNEQVVYQRQNAWIGDANFANVSLLLHMDGSNGSTAFTDSSLNALTVTANGDAKISTAQSKFGGASAEFDGTGDFLSLSSSSLFGFGTGDFTLECWLYRAAAIATDLMDFRSSNGALPWVWNIDGSSRLGFYTPSGLLATSTAALSTGVWQHVAITRQSGTIKLFIDGTLDGSAVNTSDFGSSQPVRIASSVGGGALLNGYIDDLRITKGVARYTANFAPPTNRFPDA